MKEKAFYQCEHCIYYTPYYNICESGIYKVYCGHCDFRNRAVKPSLRDCQHFKLLNENEKIEQKREIIENYEKYLCESLHKIEKSIKSFKLYINKDEQNQKVDNFLKEVLK